MIIGPVHIYTHACATLIESYYYYYCYKKLQQNSNCFIPYIETTEKQQLFYPIYRNYRKAAIVLAQIWYIEWTAFSLLIQTARELLLGFARSPLSLA